MNDSDLAHAVMKFQAHQPMNEAEVAASIACHEEIIYRLLMFGELYNSALERLHVDLNELEESYLGFATAKTISPCSEVDHVSK